MLEHIMHVINKEWVADTVEEAQKQVAKRTKDGFLYEKGLDQEHKVYQVIRHINTKHKTLHLFAIGFKHWTWTGAKTGTHTFTHVFDAGTENSELEKTAVTDLYNQLQEAFGYINHDIKHYVDKEQIWNLEGKLEKHYTIDLDYLERERLEYMANRFND